MTCYDSAAFLERGIEKAHIAAKNVTTEQYVLFSEGL